MDVLEAAEDLIDEGLEVGIGKWLARADDGSKITLHEFCEWSDCNGAGGVTDSPS